MFAKAGLKERLRPYVDTSYVDQIAAQEKFDEAPAKKEQFKLIRRIGTLLEGMSLFERYQAGIEMKLAKAGLLLRPSEFMVIIGMAALLGMGLGVIVSGGRIYIGLIGAVIGFYLPGLHLKRLQKKRVKSFENQLGNCLTLTSNSLRAGYSFTQALSTVATETLPPMSDEFKRVLREDSLGVTLEKAMVDLTHRIDSEDLELIVTAVLIQRKVGGNLSEVLDNIAHTIRERIRLKGEIKTLTAQGRLSGWIISLLPVAIGIILYVLQPDMMKLFVTEKLGLIMIGIGVIMQAIGIFAVTKIIAIEV
ncbi:MAG: type II secretion system F family protein [bacterium]|nr:type II secretion system F family protein [bacterium]